MANDVFANGREVSCKSADGKSICAFPDVCMTPPENPATPPGVPVPYPNTGMAKDMTSGSKKVKISDKEVMLKNKSYFKKSMGDEAGSAAKKGVVTSVNRGKVYFISWSMDVKVEGMNVVRHLDMTTHNHGSPISNTACWVYADRMTIALKVKGCEDEIGEVESKCEVEKGKVKCPCGKEVGLAKKAKSHMAKTKSEAISKFGTTASGGVTAAGKRYPRYADARKKVADKYKAYAQCMEKDECQKAARCMLTEKKPSQCCPPQTPHHVVPGSQFKGLGVGKYNYDKAPCVCAEGTSQTLGSHGGVHFRTAEKTKEIFPPKNQPFSGDERWTVGEAEEVGAEAVNEEFKNCSKECIQAQVRKKHLEMKVRKKDKIRPTAPGPVEHPMNDSSSF